MNTDLVKAALEMSLNPNGLVNVVSRRVRQLIPGAGRASLPLVPVSTSAGAIAFAVMPSLASRAANECVREHEGPKFGHGEGRFPQLLLPNSPRPEEREPTHAMRTATGG